MEEIIMQILVAIGVMIGLFAMYDLFFKNGGID